MLKYAFDIKTSMITKFSFQMSDYTQQNFFLDRRGPDPWVGGAYPTSPPLRTVPALDSLVLGTGSVSFRYRTDYQNFFIPSETVNSTAGVYNE